MKTQGNASFLPPLRPSKETGLKCQGPQLTQSRRHAGTLGRLQYPGSGGASGKEPTFQCRRPKRSSWVGEIPWRRARPSTPVFLPGESCGQRNQAGCSPWGYDWRDLEYIILWLVSGTHEHIEGAVWPAGLGDTMGPCRALLPPPGTAWRAGDGSPCLGHQSTCFRDKSHHGVLVAQ